jgi:hypothetical protein
MTPKSWDGCEALLPEFAHVSERAAIPGMARMGYANRAGEPNGACKSLEIGSDKGDSTMTSST